MAREGINTRSRCYLPQFKDHLSAFDAGQTVWEVSFVEWVDHFKCSVGSQSGVERVQKFGPSTESFPFHLHLHKALKQRYPKPCCSLKWP